MDQLTCIASHHRQPWNKSKLVGQKAPLRLKEIWAIRIRLQLAARTRELALLNLAVDSKLRSCDLVKLRVRDVTHGERVATRAIVMQQKTQRPVQCEITEQTREALAASIRRRGLTQDEFLFPSRLRASLHLSTRTLQSDDRRNRLGHCAAAGGLQSRIQRRSDRAACPLGKTHRRVLTRTVAAAESTCKCRGLYRAETPAPEATEHRVYRGHRDRKTGSLPISR
jgi:integrase